MKAILIISDGMADRPVKELDWKTPLEVAHKPALDEIAKRGICGIIDIISPGIPPGSDVATLALLGYDAIKLYPGRGALEALGSQVELSPRDVAFRCNFATVDDNMVVLDRRAGRIENNDAVKLAQSIQKSELGESSGVNFLFKNTIQHRNVLSLRGPKLSAAVSDTDPGRTGKKILEMRPLNNSKEAKLTAEIVNHLTAEFHKILMNHEVNKERTKRGLPQANIILCRGAGTVPNIKQLSHKYGIKAACVAATALVKGVCKAAGMDLIDVKGATGTPQTDYNAKVKAAERLLKRYDFVLIHVKATDVASHDKNPRQKVETIERLDSAIGYLLDHIDRDSTYVSITADHTTSTATGNHEGDPVPVAIIGPHIRRDDVETFNERSCAKGGLNRIRGMDLMPTLMNLLGRVPKFGA